MSRHFGRRAALSRVSFTCPAGEIVAVLGPNGAGKSTLLSVAATLLAPSTGEVRYGEHAGRQDPELRRQVGLLGHDLYLYPELSASENLSFFAQMYGLDGIRGRVAAALDRSGLAARAGDAVGGFSRGLRQRLALERALLHDPRLVLLDEPFTGLDDTSAAALADRLRALRRDGRIVVITTHDLEMIEEIADRTVLLRSGRIVALGPGGTLRERYRAGLAAEPAAR